jgi:transposase
VPSKKAGKGKPPAAKEIRAMMPTAERLTVEQKEYRRKRALELLATGWQQSAVALALGVSQGAVSQWARASREGHDMEARTSTGRPGHMTDEQMSDLAQRIQGMRPTAKELVDLIRVFYGVTYSAAHASRILHKLRG